MNVKSGKGREVMREFWDEVNDCLGIFEKGRRIVVFGDVNGRVKNSVLASVVGKWGVEEANENGEQLVDVCAERGLFLMSFLSAQDDPPVHVEKETGWGTREELD